jgi:hypothetical protein
MFQNGQGTLLCWEWLEDIEWLTINFRNPRILAVLRSMATTLFPIKFNNNNSPATPLLGINRPGINRLGIKVRVPHLARPRLAETPRTNDGWGR